MLALAVGAVGQGCAGAGPPLSLDEVRFEERLETQPAGDLLVSVALPTIPEARAIYGVDLAEKAIQPVWVEVQNHGPTPYWFLTAGLDPEYFSPSEAAYAFADAAEDPALHERFERLDFVNPIWPGTTVSGFVLTNLDEGFKVVDIDLIARGDAKSLTFITRDPEFKSDVQQVDLANLWAEDELIHIEGEGQLRAALEALPCCTTNADGSDQGDPLNLVMIGSRDDIGGAIIRRQWHATEIIWSESLWRTVSSYLQGSRYRYSPISPLYVYGRPQDFAAQKARGSIHERNHMRYWLTPIRYRGQEVWVGQISRDVGVKFTLKSPTISTHEIDPDVDEARRHLIEDLAYSQAMTGVGHVEGVSAAPEDQPRTNLVGDPYFTDGLRAVMFFEPRPLTLGQIQILDWVNPSSRAAGAAAAAGETP